MSNLIVIPTGYMGSGSSAVTDFISEINGFDIGNRDFEYVFTHGPNGLFDLEDKLLIGNNALRSDEAIHAFLSFMQILHYEKNYWYGSYRSRISADFFTYCREFIQDLQPMGMSGVHWYYQENITAFSKRVRWHLRRVLAKLTKQDYLFGQPLKPLDYYDVLMAYPTPDEFYTAARRFLGKIYASMGYAEHNLVLDQFLLPHNLFRIDRYFDDRLRVFVVDRDPRDVFLLNKYIWTQQADAIPLPFDVEEFCRSYEGIRRCEASIDDARVLRVHFEDLVFRYEQTAARIYAFLGVDPQAHTRRQTLFDPRRSANNTRLFDWDPAYRAEAEIIEKRLPQYLYDFPAAPVQSRDASQIF